MEPSYKGHEFEALKLRYEDQVGLLLALTELDFKIFGGFMTIQLLLGGWLSAHPTSGCLMKVGLLLIDLALAALAIILLFQQYVRRKEVIETVRNLNEALGYTQKDVYLAGKAINPKPSMNPWFWWYVFGIVIGVIGLCLILYGVPAPITADLSALFWKGMHTIARVQIGI